MALSAILSTLEGLTEEEQKHYTEKDGKYVLDVTAVDGFELADVRGLRNTVKTLRNEKDELEGNVSKFKNLDPAEAREAISKVKKIEEGEYEFDKDEAFNKRLEAERNKMAEKHTEEINDLDKQNQSLRGQLRTIFVDNVAVEAITKKDPNANVRLLLPHIVKRMEAEEYEPAKFRTIVLDKDGHKDIDGQGQPVSVDNLVDEMVQEFPEAFSGPGSSGMGDNDKGNAGDGDGGKKVISRSDQDAMNGNIEKIASGEVTVNVDE